MNYERLLEQNYNALISGAKLDTLFFEGKRGLGKTQLVKDFCEKRKLPLIILNLSAMESSDFTGLPRIVDGVTVYAKPSFLALEKGIIFLDEINCVNDHDVKSALKSLLNDRKINGHEVSKEVLIVTAGNPNDGSYDVNDFDEALKDRLIIVPFNRDYSEFISYLDTRHERSNLLDFYKLHGDALKTFSFRKLENTLNFFEQSNDVESLVFYLSPSVYTLFVEYLNKNLFNFKDLIAGEIKAKKLDSSAEKKLLLDVSDALKNDFKFTKETAKNVNHFLNDVRAENKQLFFKQLQGLALKDEKFDDKKVIWKELKLFDGLKDYLDVFLS